MTTWTVTNRATGEVVYAYTADEPVEWPGMEYATCNHMRAPEPVAPPPANRRLTRLQFVGRLGEAAMVAILSMAQQSIEIAAWVKMIDWTTPDQDGTSVDLDDPRTVAGVRSLELALISMGAVAEGWADGVLSGNGL